MIKLEHIEVTFGSFKALKDINIDIHEGEFFTFLGPSGCGKTTTLRTITGFISPSAGTVSVRGKDITHTPIEKRNIGMVFQSYALFPPMTVRENIAFGLQVQKMDKEEIRKKVVEMGKKVDLNEEQLKKKVSELSGGQRTKVLLGKLLLEKPDILLLDEPTNYLDEEHIAWLKRYLLDYENAFILISHDIPFLNDVVNIIYHMENQELNRYVGDYDHFQEVYAVKKAQLEAAYRRQQQEISELKDFVARNKARVSTRNMAMSRQKKLDKMDVIELAAEKPKPEFHFRYGRTPGKMLFETHDLVIGYDEPLSKPLNFTMERGQKIALVGTNGIGKTTLLKSILGLIPSLKGNCERGENLQLGYFEQEVKGDNKTTCIEELWQEFPSYTQYEIRSALAKCGLTTKHIESQVRVLSGGEQAKVRLCKLVNRDTNVLLLDEPTNHLDVDAKEALKSALKEYRGSILLICHEPEFYQDVVNEVWDMSKWTTKVF